VPLFIYKSAEVFLREDFPSDNNKAESACRFCCVSFYTAEVVREEMRIMPGVTS